MALTDDVPVTSPAVGDSTEDDNSARIYLAWQRRLGWMELDDSVCTPSEDGCAENESRFGHEARSWAGYPAFATWR